MNKHGLYSKAAQIIRSLPQERGTAEQMIAAAKSRGVKDAELQNFGTLPTGKTTREDLAKAFEARIPGVRVDQYGENPSYLSRAERNEYNALKNNPQNIPLMPFEQRRLDELNARHGASAPINVVNTTFEDSDGEEVEEPVDTLYSGYNSQGGTGYRERLLRLDQADHPAVQLNRTIASKQRQIEYETPVYGEDHPIIQQNKQRLKELTADRDRALQEHGPLRPPRERYQSSHWSDHPDVLAHIRMQDRFTGPETGFAEAKSWVVPVVQKIANHMGASPSELGSGSAEYAVRNGLITPQEAATLSRIKGWRNGYDQAPGLGKRLLHVEELQSDWAQEGRDKGFKSETPDVSGWTARRAEGDPASGPIWEVRNAAGRWVLGVPTGTAANEEDAIRHAAMNGPADRSPNAGKVPTAPYVQNTQHWTDLALKNVLREAAMGNYDGVVFTPGQAQADRYGLEKQMDSLVYDPASRNLRGFSGNRPVVDRIVNDHDELKGMIGNDYYNKLMLPENTKNAGSDDQVHILKGDDLKMGGQGMKGYYDQIVPKSVMKLAQQHDPSVAPGQPVPFKGDDGTEYQGFHLPMTDKLKRGILNEGFPAFRRGGRVAFAQGGRTDDQDAGTRSATSAQEGELPVAGGVRGGAGLLQAQGEPPLEGLPTSVRIPLTGETLQAGPDPRIRAIARDYMSRTGMPYNPPTKYAKVDPARAKRIAAAYEAMPHNPSDPLTKASYGAMIKETLAQYQAAKAAGFRAEFWNPSKDRDPYEASPRMAVEDVRNNHHMWVYPTLDGYGSGAGITEEEARNNPMLQLTGETWNGIPVTVNDIFRAVHDYYGHAKEGVGFRHDGEENAWRAHASMYSPLARLAMTTETRGQNSWLNFGPHGDKNQSARTEDTVFAPQKMGILPHWAHHEGAEDFMGPQDIAEMSRQRAKHSGNMDRALAVTRRFTKDGQHVTMRLKD